MLFQTLKEKRLDEKSCRTHCLKIGRRKMWAMFSISMTILLFSPLSEVMCVTLLKWADLYKL